MGVTGDLERLGISREHNFEGVVQMKRSIIAVAMASTLLASCGGHALRYAGVENRAEVEGLREAGVVYFECKGAKPSGFSPIAAAGIGIAIDTAIGAISKSLANAQKARTGSWTASNSTDMIATGCAKGSMTLKRGVFLSGTEAPSLYPAFDLRATVTTEQSKVSNYLIVTITPDELYYSDTSARSRGKGKKDVTLGLSISSVGGAASSANSEGSKPADGKEPTDEKKAESEPGTTKANILNLGKLEIGKKYTNLGTSVSFSVPKGARHNVSVIVTESEDPSVVLDAFAAAFESNKSDLGKALRDAIGGSAD